ncbi:hypothetical protein TELCIR_19454 [Teladorsagia circumcincta]|uniref:valine--tRNA ligase n=1 Tax=Teladorsagia circumcincta TaxID=45464 RepID=A0A2G9TME4_TELCI|nr:hypothetical protein TELCIR_19454 [Teladorsagia circumcincta]
MVAYVETIIENSNTLKEVDSDHPADEWILSRLAGALEQVDNHMSQYMPHLAFMELQSFILGSLCDVYLASFFQLQRSVELESDMDILLAMVSSVRSIRQQLQLPSSMVFRGALHCDEASHDFSRLAPVLFDLAKFDLLEVISHDHAVPSGFTVCPLPGRNGRLSLKIEDSYRSDFVSRLQRLMKKSEERSDQFRKKAEKYEAIVLRDKQEGKVKPHVIDKNEKKARQARGVANGALEEVARIRVLLEEMSA